MKSIPIAMANLRSALAEVLESVREGGRIRITRHGRPIAWIIGKTEHAMLERLQARAVRSTPPPGPPVRTIKV